jgi:transposase
VTGLAGLLTGLSIHSVAVEQFLQPSFGRIEEGKEKVTRPVIAGVDTHKDLHVAAVVDQYNRVIGTQSFAATRQGYRQMLIWMRAFGDLQKVGIESTGTYGAGLLRFLQAASVDVLEVTAPDRQDRRRPLSGS